MTPMETRLQCLRLAVDTQGNPNKLQLAQAYYEFANTPEQLGRIEKIDSRKTK